MIDVPVAFISIGRQLYVEGSGFHLPSLVHAMVKLWPWLGMRPSAQLKVITESSLVEYKSWSTSVPLSKLAKPQLIV